MEQSVSGKFGKVRTRDMYVYGVNKRGEIDEDGPWRAVFSDNVTGERKPKLTSAVPVKTTRLWVLPLKGTVFCETKDLDGRTKLFPVPKRWKTQRNGEEFISVIADTEFKNKPIRQWVSRARLVWGAAKGGIPKGYKVNRKRSDRWAGGYGIDNLVCGPAPAMVRQSQPRLPMGEYRIAKSNKAKPKDWISPAAR